MRFFRFLAWAVTLVAAGTVHPAPVRVVSPDGNLSVAFDLRDLGGKAGCPVYRVDWKGRPIVTESRLGLEIEGAPLVAGLSIAGQTTARSDTTWKPVCGERAGIRDRYNEAAVDLKETAAPGRLQRTCRRRRAATATPAGVSDALLLSRITQPE